MDVEVVIESTGAFISIEGAGYVDGRLGMMPARFRRAAEDDRGAAGSEDAVNCSDDSSSYTPTH